MTFAAANGRVPVVDYLLIAGVPIDSAPYRGITGLHLAVQFVKPNMIGRLTERGASLTAVDDEWNATPGGWAEACNDGSAERQAIADKFNNLTS